ncbi:MAG TPA: energy transducer TonB [Bryobacteraceae bacterium]|nr:energy transducer TonB [Bryobacteraceae bacterium]
METVVQPPGGAEIHILTDWGDAADSPRKRRAAVFSVLVHVVAVVTLFTLPKSLFVPPPQMAEVRITPLIEPLTELTQNAPNKGKINKEFNATELNPRPRIQVPMGLPSATLPQAPRPAVPAPPLPEPPKVEAAVKEVPKVDLPPPPPPQIQAVETPKLAFETPSAPPPPLPPGQAKVPVPDTSVSGAIRQAARAGAAGGLVVGDFGASGPGGYGPGVNLPPSPGSQGSNMQLLSDPQGVDFRPYLIRILASVKQHWQSVMPESAKLGRRGTVAIQFSIARNGQVPKLVIAEFSGAEALDRAAVAGISASVPFPPLPAEFKGDRIVLQMNFAYNMPRQ